MEQPIEAMQGFKGPGDVLYRTLHKLGFRFRKGKHAVKIPLFGIDLQAFSSSRLPPHLACPPKRLIAPWDNPDGTIVCSLNGSSGLAELHLKMGEKEINLCEELAEFTFIDTSLAADGGTTVSTVGAGVVSLLTDQIPVWGEISLIIGVASMIPRKRVRLLLEFKTEREPLQREPLLIETAELVAILLDSIVGFGGGSAEDDKEEIYVMC